MANIASVIRQYLVDNVRVEPYLGTRIHPLHLPQDATLPAAVYSQISTRHAETIDGSKGGLAWARIEIAVYSETIAEAHDIAERIRLCGILDLQGTTGGIDIRAVRVDSGIDYSYDPPTDGSDQNRYAVFQDFEICYVENV